MNFQRGRAKEPLEINLVPMIDVMLVILIFLMITTTYSKYTELQINLPSAQAERQLQRPNEISILATRRASTSSTATRCRSARSSSSPASCAAPRRRCRSRSW